jgi:hypothetical protein
VRNGSFPSMVSDRAWIGRGRRQSLGKPPAHLDRPSRARFNIPNDDRQQTANAIGDDFVVAALVATLSFASAALCERLRKRDVPFFETGLIDFLLTGL